MMIAVILLVGLGLPMFGSIVLCSYWGHKERMEKIKRDIIT